MKEISKHTERAFNSSADFNANDHSNSNPELNLCQRQHFKPGRNSTESVHPSRRGYQQDSACQPNVTVPPPAALWHCLCGIVCVYVFLFLPFWR